MRAAGYGKSETDDAGPLTRRLAGHLISEQPRTTTPVLSTSLLPTHPYCNGENAWRPKNTKSYNRAVPAKTLSHVYMYAALALVLYTVIPP